MNLKRIKEDIINYLNKFGLAENLDQSGALFIIYVEKFAITSTGFIVTKDVLNYDEENSSPEKVIKMSDPEGFL